MSISPQSTQADAANEWYRQTGLREDSGTGLLQSEGGEG